LRRRRIPVLGAFIAAALVLTAGAGPVAAVGTQMFATVPASTGEKPQSKIWYHDNSYWAILQGPGGVQFYEKVGSSWQAKTFANAILTAAGNADVKWNGTHLFVLVYAPTVRLYKYTYVSASRAYALVSGFPITLANPSGSETMVLDQDSSGRLWASAEGDGNIYAYYSTSADHRTWAGTPVTLQTGVDPDDISSVVAFGGNRIGVFWSDQARWEFGFRYHDDTAAPTSWSSVEVVASGNGISDDHVNIAADASGRVYAVTKDSSNEMRVHRRATNGTWTTRTGVLGGGTGTRGIIQIAEADAKVYILFTRWGVAPERIEYRVADMSTLTFASTTTFISATNDMNNVTGLKQPLPAGNLIAIAENLTHCWYNSIGSLSGGPQPPGPPADLTATLNANPTRVNLAWSQPASGAPDGYNVYVQVDGGAFTRLNGSLVTATNYTHSAPPGAPLCYHVRAVDNSLEGAESNADCVDNTPLPPPGIPLNLSAGLTTVPVALQLDFDAGSGQAAYDGSGNGNHARLGSTTGADASDPVWTAGVTGTALQFDGSNDYALVSDSPALEFAGSFSVHAWARHADGAGSGTLVSKGDTSGDRTMRVRITSGRDVEFRWDTTSGSSRTVTATDAIPDADWHHVACVYDKSAGQNRIYIDGGLVASASATGTPVANDKPLYIGTRFGTSFQNYLEGSVDALCIVPQALAGSAVLAVAQGGREAVKRGESGLAAERAQLAWQVPANGSPPSGYHVYRAAGGGAFARITPAPVATTSYADGILSPGAYCYRVTAVNAQGLEGGPSTQACLEVVPAVLESPGGFTAQLVLVPDPPVAAAAAYDFDAGAGETFADATGNGHTGVRGSTAGSDQHDPRWVGGIFGACLWFDQKRTRATVDDAPDLHFAASFTVEAWIAVNACSTTQTVVSKGTDGAVAYALAVEPDGLLRLVWHDSSGVDRGALSTSGLDFGTWHHVAGVFDAAAGESRVYIDGQWAGTQATTGALPAPDAAALVLGARAGAGNYTDHFGGSIDFVRVTPAALYSGDFALPQTLAPPSDRRVDLAWDAIPTPFVAGYNVYRRVGGAMPEQLNAVPLATHLFADLTPPGETACYFVAAVDTLGREGAATADACIQGATTDAVGPPPSRLLGLEAFPNPFNPTTTIAFDLPVAAQVRLRVYDVRGRHVATLADGRHEAGAQRVGWDGTGAAGVRAPSGVYFAVLEIGSTRLRHKLVLAK